MACTLPCLKQFLAMFESGMIGEYSGSGTNSNNSNTAASAYYHTGSGSGKGTLRSDRHYSNAEDSIALVSLARRRGGGSGAATAAGTAIANARPETSVSATRHRPTSGSNSSDEIELSLRPDQAFGDYSVASISTAAAAADASSFISDRSGTAMIIKKTQRWEVTSTRDGW